MGPLAGILDQHRGQLQPMLSKSGVLTQAALQDDATVARDCHALPPGLLRLTIKETVFIDFVWPTGRKYWRAWSAASPLKPAAAHRRRRGGCSRRRGRRSADGHGESRPP